MCLRGLLSGQQSLMSVAERGLSFSDTCSIMPRFYATSLIITLVHNDGSSLKKSITKLPWVVTMGITRPLLIPRTLSPKRISLKLSVRIRA